MSFPDPVKQHALSELKTHARSKGIKVENNKKLESMLTNIDQTIRKVSKKAGYEKGFIELVKYMRFSDETPPDPPYDHVRFDDPIEAQNFCNRVLKAHNIRLSVIPLEIHLFAVSETPG